MIEGLPRYTAKHWTTDDVGHRVYVWTIDPTAHTAIISDTIQGYLWTVSSSELSSFTPYELREESS